MKNQFEFYGIKTPVRKALVKSFLLENGYPPLENIEQIVKELWKLPEREYQYAALQILEWIVKKKGYGNILLFQYLIVNKSWWDTVDWLATRIVGVYLRKNPDQIVTTYQRWMKSDNLWLQRVCLLFQLKYKKDTDLGLLHGAIKELLNSKEFFIQKAIGWALREYSKVDPDAVLQFVEHHSLSPLSRREALKIIDSGEVS